MMRQYFRGLPKELEEAAYVDGAGTIKAFVRVFLASARQIMMTVFLFSFVWQWLVTFLPRCSCRMCPCSPPSYSGSSATARVWTRASATSPSSASCATAAMLFLIIPMLILYLFCQRYFTESIERAGLVG